jgi:ABC-2 type transport system permease protein
MNRFSGIVHYEYTMSIRRWGLWLAFAVAALPFGFVLTNAARSLGQLTGRMTPWQLAGQSAVWLNYFVPVAGGIVLADRLARDMQLGVRELLWSTLTGRAGYVLGKYLGALLSVLTPVLLISLLGSGFLIVRGVPAALLPASLVAFLAINLPAYAFVAAFSLACPAVLPVRAYQVLFTGYWFWGNFLNSQRFPTLAGTILTPSGLFALGAFFRHAGVNPTLPASAVLAWLNLLVLAACSAAALLGLGSYLRWQQERL